MENSMEKAMDIRREMRGKETLSSLLRASLEEIKNKESEDPLEEKPSKVFEGMKNDNEIRGNYTKLEFLKLAENDLAIAITDLHGDKEKLKAVLDYVKLKKEEIEGEIHIINMGDIASGDSGLKEDVDVLFDLLKGSRDGDFNLHLLQGNIERDIPPVESLYEKFKEVKEDAGAFPAMTNLFKSLPSSLFLENGIMLTHSTLPLVNKKRFEEEGLEIYNRDAGEIDKLGLREPSGTWASFDGEREESEYGGTKMFQLGKDTFRSTLKTLGLNKILRGHDSSLIKNKAKETGVHQLTLDEGEVDTFHTSSKATKDFGIFVEINPTGDVEFKKI